mgnify:CR=1 FL=1
MKKLFSLLKLSIFLPFFFLLSSCAITDVNHYKNEQPKLDLEKYFIGTTEAWGMFQKRSGEVVKRFYVSIEGKKVGENLILDEVLLFRVFHNFEL